MKWTYERASPSIRDIVAWGTLGGCVGLGEKFVKKLMNGRWTNGPAVCLHCNITDRCGYGRGRRSIHFGCVNKEEEEEGKR